MIERKSDEDDTQIIKSPDKSLSIRKVPYDGIVSIQRANELLQVYHPYNYRENIRNIRRVLGEAQPPQDVLDYIQDIQQTRPGKRYLREPGASVVPWTREVIDHGQDLLDAHLKERGNHTFTENLRLLKKSVLTAKRALNESVFDTKRYLEFFFPRLPFDETEEISFDAIIPTMKKILWGAYENTGVPFHTYGKVERKLEKEKPILAGPSLPGEHYDELAGIMQENLATFATNLEHASQIAQEVTEYFEVDKEEVRKPFDEKGRLATAVNIANTTTQAILSEPNNPQSGVLGMHLWRSLKEIKKRVDPLIGKNIDVDSATTFTDTKGLVPQINSILKPRYPHFIHVLTDQGYRWDKDWRDRRKDSLSKPLEE